MVIGEPLIHERRGEIEVMFSGVAVNSHAGVGASLDQVAWVRQVHGRTVVEASSPGEQGEADGLMTGEVGLSVVVQTADCVPILLAGGGRVAAVHAGWRGLAQGIVEHAVERLGVVEHAWIGPAIGACCYEVGPEVAAVFRDDDAVAAGAGDRSMLDLVAVARRRLPAGLSVAVAAVCTRCDPRWWSYRRSAAEGRRAGRNFALIRRGGST